MKLFQVLSVLTVSEKSIIAQRRKDFLNLSVTFDICYRISSLCMFCMKVMNDMINYPEKIIPNK
jgi:hypothetical protein